MKNILNSVILGELQLENHTRLLPVAGRQALLVYGCRENKKGQRYPSKHSRLIGYNVVLSGIAYMRDSQGVWLPQTSGSIFCYGGDANNIRYDNTATYREIYVVIDRSTAEHLSQAGMPMPEVGWCLACPEDDELIQQFWAFYGHDTRCSPEQSLLYVQQLFLGCHERKNQAPLDQQFITEACRLLTRFWNRTVPEIAEELGCSQETFRRRFKEALGQSPVQYRRVQRIEQACLLLPHNAIKAVAGLLGYATPFAFSLHFKQAKGMSPSEWKRCH